MADMCSQCRLDTGGNHERTCPLHPDNRDKTDQRVDAPLVGWTCPACGGGLSPFTNRCPCVPLPAPVIEMNRPQPQVHITVDGFIGSNEDLAAEIGRIMRLDPPSATFESFDRPEPPTGRVQKESERP